MDEGTAFAGKLVAVIAILVLVIIGVLVYFQVATSGEMTEYSESFTATNTTNFTCTLTYKPYSSNEFVGWWYNSSDSTWYEITANLTQAGKAISFVTTGNQGLGKIYMGITTVNFSYNSTVGVVVRDDVNPQAQTTFTLAPIIAIVAIAAVIIGLVAMFGGSKRGI